MVRTFLCYPFKGHLEFTDQYDVSTFCSTEENRYFVGSHFGSIVILDFKNNSFSTFHKFLSIGIPVKLIYCDEKKFLISLESRLQDYRTGVSAREMNCQARVYYNIFSDAQKTVQPLSSGYSINSTIYPSSNEDNKFTAIELTGVRQPVTDIALCYLNKNIAVSSSRKVYLYAFKEIEQNEKNGKGIDFIRMIEVETTLNIRNIALSSNWLAFSSKTEIRVIQLHLHQPSDQNVYQGEEATEISE